MALTRYPIVGYGQIELNRVAFKKTGAIEAQCALATDLAQAENGMILAVNKMAKTIEIPTTTGVLPFALHYSAEKVANQYTSGLKDYVNDGEYLPRLGYLSEGDLFTTNCLAYDTTEFTTLTALNTALTGTALWGGITTGTIAGGAITLTTTKPTIGPALKMIKKTDMPDGTIGVQFQAQK